MLQKKYYKMVRVSYADSDLFRITNVSDQPGTLTITNGGGTLKYSLDGVDFTTYDFTTHPTISVPAGGNVYMKGVKSNPTSNFLNFNMDVNHTIGGNIMSIVDETNYATMTSAANYYFRKLFYGDTHLISAADLNFGQVTTVNTHGMNQMFDSCTSLTTAPDLSNVTSVGNDGMYIMFGGCTHLTTAPDLSNVTSVGNDGMSQMFNSCTSLTTAPDLSNVTSVGDNGMPNMFYGCTALTTAPDLSNVTSVGNYGMTNMFYGCTALTTAPDLSNVTSVGIYGMNSMFNSCTSLTTAYAPNLSTWGNTSKWLEGVAASGTLYCPSQAVSDIIPSGTSGCPSGWTKVVMA